MARASLSCDTCDGERRRARPPSSDSSQNDAPHIIAQLHKAENPVALPVDYDEDDPNGSRTYK